MKTAAEILSLLKKERERLLNELTEMEQFHIVAWKECGSELSASEMSLKEKALRTKIENLSAFIKDAEGVAFDEYAIVQTLKGLKFDRKYFQSIIKTFEERIKKQEASEKLLEDVLKIAGISIPEEGHS